MMIKMILQCYTQNDDQNHVAGSIHVIKERLNEMNFARQFKFVNII